jgi:hypothetical protein
MEPFMKRFVLVFFFNDILIYSSILELYINHLKVILEILKEN